LKRTTEVILERWPLILGLSAVPASIAISEGLLSIAAFIQLFRLMKRRVRMHWPRCLWFWLAWALMEVALWLSAPQWETGWAEIRHLLVLAGLFLALSGFTRTRDIVLAWKGVFLMASASSLFLIGQFLVRLNMYGDEIAAGGDAGFYLRSSGFIGHWMVYATIEIVVVAGLLAFWSAYPSMRRWMLPIALINATAVILSLTRMTWLTCLVLAAIALVWTRSRWLWAMPLIPLAIYALGPDSVRSRAGNIADLTYYSNAERLQMLGVGWRMVGDYPLTGVGAGRVEGLYQSYLAAGAPIPAYHGHLHNNAAQLAAQFGLPVLAAAGLFVFFAFRDLFRLRRRAADPDSRFIADAAILALAGFLIAGMFDYTYGHALGLIAIGFAVVPALLMPSLSTTAGTDKFVAPTGLDDDTARWSA